MTATELISTNVATGLVYERLSDVAFRIQSSRSHYCVVLSDDGLTFVGLVRLADVAGRSNPGNRILGDLVGQIRPMFVRPDEPAIEVATLFVKHSLAEAIVLDADKLYLGLITTESVLAWTLQTAKPIVSIPEASVLPTIKGSDRLQTGVVLEKKVRSGRVILLVEDHTDSRNVLATVLRRRNYKVIESGSVQEAMSLAQAHELALVISDIELPDGSGFGLMKELSQQYGLRGIAVSGISLEFGDVSCRAAGFTFHLKKPIRLRDLDAAIKAILTEVDSVVS